MTKMKVAKTHPIIKSPSLLTGRPSHFTRLLSIIWVTTGAFLISACVDLKPVQGHALSTNAEQRFTDEAIARDLKVFQNLRSRIAKIYPQAGSVYVIARADAMTELAAKEYEENDKTGISEALLDDVLRLLVSQEQGQVDVRLDLPSLPGISKVNPELWKKIESIKNNPKQMNCAGEPIARLEIGLLELAHEQYEVDEKLNSAEHTLNALNAIAILVTRLDSALAVCQL